MANLGQYLYSSNNESATLHARVRQNENITDDLVALKNDLQQWFESDLPSRSGLSTRFWLQGSQKWSTAINPVDKKHAADIDLGVYFALSEADEQRSANELRGYVSDSMNQWVKSVDEGGFLEKYSCLRLLFDEKYQIDVSVYSLQANMRKLAQKDNTFIESDSRSLYLWFKDRLEKIDAAQARRIIRYLKSWRDLSEDDVRTAFHSTAISCCVADEFSESDREDVAFQKTVEAIIKRLESSSEFKSPVNASVLLDAASVASVLEELKGLSVHLSKAAETDNEARGALQYELAFDFLFPPAVVSVGSSESSTNMPALSYIPDIFVSVYSRTPRQFLRNAHGEVSVPIGCSLEFRLRNQQTFPPGTEFYWKVKNQGDEAMYNRDIGHHSPRAYEITEYPGVHFMECVAVQNGVVIGWSAIPVKIHSKTDGHRVRKKKPSYTKIRRK